MAANRRTTICFPTSLYRALKVRAAVSGRTFSEIVTEAVQLLLSEEATDHDAIQRRHKEPSRTYANVLRELKRDGLL